MKKKVVAADVHVGSSEDSAARDGGSHNFRE